jgi:histidinol-phosphate aminotransferase
VSAVRSLDPVAFVRPELRALAEYGYAPASGEHKLDQNEVPWELPRWVKREVARRLAEADWARYPDFHADALRRELGRLHGWPWEGVLLGNGSNELLALALEALAPQGGEVLGAEPCFGLYRMFVTRAGARPRFLPPRPDLRLPTLELAAEIEAAPRRPLLLASPNNPTGDAATPREIQGLLARLDAPLLLDNAYAEFCRHDYRPLLAGNPHLLLFRTFSKAWSLAGLRLGYLLAHPDLVRELTKVKLPYNLGHAGAIAGQLVVKEAQPAARRRVAAILGRRPEWARRLAQAGLTVFPSEGNFLLVRVPSGSTAAALQVKEALARRGILVRDVGAAPGLAGCLRVSIGDGRALRATREALAESAEIAEVLR